MKNENRRDKLKAESLTIGEGFVNPLGFHDPSPVFSWKLPAEVKAQTAYEIEVCNEWGSGWVESAQSVRVPYGGMPFKSRERKHWRVRFRDDQGWESCWSEPASFELGLLTAKEWKAQWIRPAEEARSDSEPVAWLRRMFGISREIERARLYVTARGLFEVHLNGRRVGSDYFANGWTSYSRRLDTLTYDLTDQLKSGENEILALLGTGWYAGHLSFENKKNLYGMHSELLLQLEIIYVDGGTETVCSDEAWEGTFDGPIRSSSLYDGEDYDARRAPAGWAGVFSCADLGKAALVPKPFAPVRVMDVLEVHDITEPEPGRCVFDLGQNMVGRVRLRIPVEKDGTVMIRYAEMLDTDGTLYTENYRSAKSIDFYTAAETGTIEWESTFTFHGFRYVELSCLPAGIKPQKDWVAGIVLHTGFSTVGTFGSSHEKLNRLQSNLVWGQRGNFLDIPTDCPQRDERLGWTGDAQVICPTSLFNFDCHAFWKSWLGSMRDDQFENGWIPHVIPDVLGDGIAASPGWVDAAVFIPWDVYVRTGDVDVLRENYGMMVRLVDWYRDQTVDGLLPDIKGFGDWLQPYAGDSTGDTPFHLIGMAYYTRCVQILSDIAAVLDKQDDAERYRAEAAELKGTFAAHYFDLEGKLRNAPETQTAYLLAFTFGLVPDELREKTIGYLVRRVDEAGGHLHTGFLGTPYIVSVLDQIGRADLAYDILFRETYPGWFFSINQGATTMWERWNSYTREDGFGDASMNSFNHYAYGAIGRWMAERIAGLAPDPAHPGYKHFFIRPLPGGPLEWARAELETPYGKAVSEWRKVGEGIEMDVVVPPNTTATIEFPDGREPQTVPAGTHRFEPERGAAGE